MFIVYEKESKKVDGIYEKRPVSFSDTLDCVEYEGEIPQTDEYEYLTFENGQVTVKVHEWKEQAETQKKIAELKAHLSKTDYQAIKFAEGELTEEEFAPIKEQRRAWRVEINELEEKIENQQTGW
jgi:hypothetical protein